MQLLKVVFDLVIGICSLFLTFENLPDYVLSESPRVYLLLM